MKKLPTSCAVVVFLAVLAYQVKATTVALTKDTVTPGTLSAAETLFPDRDLFTINEILGALYIRDNNDVTLSNILGAVSFGLTSDGSDLPKYIPIIDITVLLFDEDSSAGNYIRDAVYVRVDNGLILPTIPAAMPGGLILEDKGFPEYNPMPDVTTLFYYKDLFAVSDILNIVYLRNNDGTILTTYRPMFSSLIFGDLDLPYYNPISNIAILFFDEELFVRNQIFDMVYIPGSNIIPSAASDATLEDLTFDNKGPLGYNHPISIEALYLGEGIFANIGTFYITTDSFVIPEPAPIAVLGLGSLYLLRKRKSRGRPMCLPRATLRRQSYGASATTSGCPY
ncbi:MAG TPA: hypothetical protein VMW72_21130 [Sedimentisphaerales bacterium]|nr:hypothetical protein [Sedimentisphaerales bacterium]